MRADATSPRTWLLGAVAGWAMLVWGLALFGLGGRIERLADDPALAQRLPALPSATSERLGPFAQYNEFTSRPLFYEERRPLPFLLQPEGEEQRETFDFMLTSVLLTPRLQLAIIQPTGGGESIRLRVGEAPDSAPSYQLLSLTPRGAVFTGPEGEQSLELRVFDGAGGEAPTAMRLPSANSGAAGSAGRGPARGMTPAPVVQPTPGKPATTTGINPPAPAVTSPPAGPPQTSDAQVEEIRKRIEARRAQLREQSQPEPVPDKTQ